MRGYKVISLVIALLVCKPATAISELPSEIPLNPLSFLVEKTAANDDSNLIDMTGVQTKGVAQIDLFDWLLGNIDSEDFEAKEKRFDPYNRRKHFGSWINPENDCQDTRTKVLIRDANDNSLEYIDNDCKVVKGDWFDPYTAKWYRMAASLQIDHIVPLRHAYYMGGWKWTQEARCHYANFLEFDSHLLAVSAHENMSKGDSAPHEYMPPNEQFVCDYLHHWMEVKAIWQLKASEEEADAIQELFAENGCSTKYKYMGIDRLRKLRAKLSKVPTSCENRPTP